MALPNTRPRPRSIMELIAAQKATKATPAESRVIDSLSLPFSGATPEQLAHESEVAALRVPRVNALVHHRPAFPHPTHVETVEYVDTEVIEPVVNQAEFLGIEQPATAAAESSPAEPVVVHVHLHEAPKPRGPIPGFGKPRFIPVSSRENRPLVAASVARADAAIAESNKLLSLPSPETVEYDPESGTEDAILDDNERLDRLIDDDFPFDDTQLAAVHGMVTHQYACMVGEAGTGKTTVTKKLVDLLKTGVAHVDLSGYWQRGEPDEDAEYERPTHLIPSICMVSFTGRASQMVKKNFPKTWHPNIMTIHRMLGFYPEFYEEPNDKGEMVGKKRFVPAYTAINKVPWKIIIIDEAGMLGLELWHQLLAACPEDTRIYMIGDIRQLPPTHGKSILGFALGAWPTYALTHVHRQKGVNNSIVDNAHRVMNGLQPQCDSKVLAPDLFPKGMSFPSPDNARDPDQVKEANAVVSKTLKWLATNKEWRFLNIRIDNHPGRAQMRIRQVMKLLNEKTDLYDPNRDIIITPTNGFEPTAPGYVLGQQPLNQGLVTLLNAGSTRYLIDAGRERQNFSVGDKVMATVNDYEAGITNGMTGIVEEIRINGAYAGNKDKYGPAEDVARYLESLDSDQDEDDIDLDDMIQAGREALMEKEKEKRDSGPASHTVVVRFGEGDHGFTVDFSSKSQVASLMLAYAATCHKMQGGEAPLVFVIVHGTQKKPLNREWLYTAITRASGRCVLLSTQNGIGTALSKQSIKGKTLEDKIASFKELTVPNRIGAKMNVRLPEPRPYLMEV